MAAFPKRKYVAIIATFYGNDNPLPLQTDLDHLKDGAKSKLPATFCIDLKRNLNNNLEMAGEQILVAVS